MTSSPRTGFSLILFTAVLALALGTARASARRTEKRTPPPGAGVSGNLSVVDLRVHEVAAGGAEPRLVVQALVENQSPVSRSGAYALKIRHKDSRRELGVCTGNRLPQGQIALCELWLVGESASHGDVFEALLDRTAGDFGTWDGDPGDDGRRYSVRTITEGGQVLRLAQFDVAPQLFQGATEVQFRFQVEGGHLVWLLAEDRPPRLLAGHPADGLLVGKGRERIISSSPLTLVARDSFGSFVYQTIPVFNTYEQPSVEEARLPEERSESKVAMKVLEPGIYDVDEDQVILEKLRVHLAAKDWAQALQQLRDAPHQRPAPRPASALNPKTRQTPEPASVPEAGRGQ